MRCQESDRIRIGLSVHERRVRIERRGEPPGTRYAPSRRLRRPRKAAATRLGVREWGRSMPRGALGNRSQSRPRRSSRQRRGIAVADCLGEVRTSDQEHDAGGSHQDEQRLSHIADRAIQLRPEIDTLLFLRPTESALVFLQQLGRGLRLAGGKDCVTVLDFIGEENRRFRFNARSSGVPNFGPPELRNLDSRTSEPRNLRNAEVPYCCVAAATAVVGTRLTS
jgi:hypothetical protein